MKMKIFVSDDVRMTNGDLWNEDAEVFSFHIFLLKLVGLVATVPFKVLEVMLLRITTGRLQ